MPGKLGVALTEACDKFANQEAICGGLDPLTYSGLAKRARRIADLLKAGGLAANEPVHVAVSNASLDVAAFLGVWQAGGVVVPLHRTTPAAAAAKIQAKTQARYLVDMRATASGAASELSEIDSAPPPFREQMRDAAFVIFTSGSTGSPKGVVVSHNAFHGKIEQIDRLLKFQAGDSTLLVLNITFSFGIWISLLTLLRGGKLVMLEKYEPALFLQTLIDRRIKRVGMVPTMMRVLFSQPQLAPLMDQLVHQDSLRQVLIGGESLGHSLASAIRQRFCGTQLIDIYGLTETSTCDFFSFPEDYARYPGCIGRPSPQVAFRIVDGDDTEVDGDDVGELQISSPYLMNGYLDEPELSAAAFSGPWFKTGDLARRVAGSVVEIMGRKKELISRGGNKVTPVEIEQLLCSHPAVAAAMAIGLPDAVLGERIHVLVVPRNGAAFEIKGMEQFLKDKLEKFKQPDVYYVREELPLGRTGKADRGQLKFMIESGQVTPIITI
ncbi:class I adenylate-forming enzyme family protein [Noviherbaspirillum sedimenti]|uniref:Long-chain fatty acid--CoA ligase n=1 Tax=Noviherbaspirillum sedimenti TaxID=2320865 RepID=A0A3A3GIE8_9BURK|nr:class I adenylate-forming enzyme family protein [Noviherbaspirillum sedimenti]RJG00690.1 long-chain fatty acid--CoA ligase [Noviherbaspirillum sedimenti]